MNQFQAIGRLVRDPETRAAGGGNVSNLQVAINRSWKDKQGEWKEEALFLRCTAWGTLADAAAQLKKGNLIFIAGSLESKAYEKDGVKRESIEVRLSRLFGGFEPVKAGKSSDDWKKPRSKEAFLQEPDDEIPF